MSYNFLIVGGGPVGFATALTLSKQGYRCTVFEGRPEISPGSPEESYPIGINARALHCLDEIDVSLGAKARETGELVNAWKIFVRSRCVSNIPSTVSFGTSRAQVNHLLSEAASRNPDIDIRLNHRLIDMDFVSKLLVFDRILPDGSKHRVTVDASLPNTRIIAADGVKSAVRRFMDKNSPGFKSTVTPWTFEFRTLFATPGHSLPHLDPQTQYLFSGNYNAVLHNGDVRQWCCVLATRDNEAAPTRDFKLATQATPVRVASLRAFLDKNVPLTSQLYTDAELERFYARRSFRGAIVQCNRLHHDNWILLLGDAAHSVHPPIGEGINSALEDVTVLAECMREERPFEAYNARRHPDAEALVQYALYLNEIPHMPGELSARIMARALYSLVHKGPDTIYHYLFGPGSLERKPYRQIVDRWRRQNWPILALTRLVCWPAGVLSWLCSFPLQLARKALGSKTVLVDRTLKPSV